MVETAALYQIAQVGNIPVLQLDIPENGSMCIQTGGNRCYIGMDHSILEDEPSRRVHLAHELGHCKTGAFYNRWAARDVRQKHEHRADKWAIEETIPEQALDEAIADGYADLWSLADYFGVTEDFMKKAVCWYTHGNLATELYF